MWEFVVLEEAKGGFHSWSRGRVVDRNLKK